MFEASDRITEYVEKVYTLTVPLKRGDTLENEAIAKATGLTPHEGAWGNVVRKVARRLEVERRISVWPNTRGGIHLCLVDEQLALPAERARRGLRQVRRGRRSVEALPEKGLTTHQRRARLFASERMREAETKLRREIRAQSEQLKPTPTIPRRRAS